MRSSLSLQRSLFRHQARQIAQQVEGGSAHFRAYQRRYARATRRFRRVIDLAEVDARVAAADLVYVGDYHTLRRAQQAYLALAKNAVRSGRRVVLAVEFVEAKHQETLDRFLQGRLSERTFLNRIGHPYRGAFDIWPGFAPIFELARAHRLQVLGIDRRASGSRTLTRRDQAAAKPIAKAAKAADRPLVLVLMGQFHVAPAHLPRQVEAILGKRADRRSLVVYQNAEAVYWALAKKGQVEHTRAVELSEREVCLMNTSPVICQRSFLDYVEAEVADEALEQARAEQTFGHLVRNLCTLFGVEVGRAPERVLVVNPGDAAQVEELRKRSGFRGKHFSRLRSQLLKREVAWVPEAQALWLASMSLNQLAEAAAHFVRTLCLNSKRAEHSARADRFLARSYESALGFFGSRLINPKRRCVPIDEWAWHFESGQGRLREQAPFVLAMVEALRKGSSAVGALLPQSAAAEDEVSRALGAMAGDALAQAFGLKRVTASEIRGLFENPLSSPGDAFVGLVQQFGLTRSRVG